ncbi:MAG: hypothetical protein GY699_05945, partial [Desulfobacteraceae bacterium]|nr:hypothetical protein [Desulfobacteraceae bacterium]
MAMGTTNFEFSNPGFYNTLISDQKKKHPKILQNAANWVELGRLQDAKAQLTKRFVQKSLIIRLLPVYFTMLAKIADIQNYPETTNLTLGQYLFVLKKTLEGEYALDAYGNYLENMFDSSGIIIGRKFLQ